MLFDFERARVKSSARPILRAIAGLVDQHPEWTSLRIEGHSDSRGETAFNQELSERRAANVRAALVDLGVVEGIIESVGYGATRPREIADAASLTEEQIFQRNRRVEFVVLARRPAATPAPAADTPVAPAAAPQAPGGTP